MIEQKDIMQVLDSLLQIKSIELMMNKMILTLFTQMKQVCINQRRRQIRKFHLHMSDIDLL